MATISLSREELMEQLAAAKARADREDAKAAAKHKRDEQAALQEFRSAIRAALKWDYETAKKHYLEVSIRNKPSCPQRHARQIEIAIQQLNMDSRKGRFHISDNSDWYRAASWLPPSDALKKSVCD